MELRLTIVWIVVAYFPDDQSLAITHYTHCSWSLTTGHDTPARVMSGLWIFRVTLRYFVTATRGHFSPGYHHRVESIKLAKNVHGGITSDVETRGQYPPIRGQMWADLTSQRQGWKPGEDYVSSNIGGMRGWRVMRGADTDAGTEGPTQINSECWRVFYTQ